MIYLINNVKYYPEKRMLVYRDESECRLNIKENLVLKMLLEKSGEVVSRQEIFDKVWENRIVEDATLTSKISTIRKALLDDSKELILTSPKEGYFIKSEFVSVLGHDQLEKKERPKSALIDFFKNKKLIMLVPFLIALYIFTHTPNNIIELEPPIAQFTNLTDMLGKEESLSFSKDGKWMAYIHQPLKSKRQFPIIQELSTRKRYEIDNGRYRYTSPVFDHLNKKLFFMHFTGEKCEIRVHLLDEQFSIVSDEFITDCGDRFNESPMSLDPSRKWLYYTFFDKETLTLDLMRFNNESKESQVVDRAGSDSWGNYAHSLSDDGEKLLILRALKGNIDRSELWFYDLTTLEKKKLKTFPIMLFNVDWFNDDKEVLFVDNRNVLSSLSLVDGSVSQLLKTEHKLTLPIEHNGLVYLMQGDVIASDNAALDMDDVKDKKFIAPSQFIDRHLSYSENNELAAFLSNRSGFPQIWLMEKNGKMIPITQNRDMHVRSLQLSPNGEKLIYKNYSSVFIYDVTTGELKELPNDVVDFHGWSCDSQSYIVTKRDAAKQTVAVENLDGELQHSFAQMGMYREDCKSNIRYFAPVSQSEIWELDDHWNLSHVVYQLDKGDELIYGWGVHDSLIALLENGHLTVKDLKTKSVISQESSPINAFSFNVQAGKILYSELTVPETTLVSTKLE